MATDYSSIPISEINNLIGERIRTIESRGLINWGPVGPLRPRTMLALLDMMIAMADSKVEQVEVGNG